MKDPSDEDLARAPKRLKKKWAQETKVEFHLVYVRPHGTRYGDDDAGETKATLSAHGQ